MKICPNYNSDYWRQLVAEHGENAQQVWFAENIAPSNEGAISVSEKIKQFKRKRYTIEQVINKSIVTSNNNEERRLYNIEIQDSNGNYTGEFFDIVKQKDSIEVVFKMSFEELIKKSKEDNKELKVEDVFDIVFKNISIIHKNTLKAFLEDNTESKFYSFIPFIKDYENIINSRKQIESFVKDKYSKLNIDVDRINESLLEDNETGEADVRGEHKASEERDPKETMSKRIKLFLSTLPIYDNVNGNIVPQISSIGLSKLYNYDELYQKVVTITSNKLDLSFDELLTILQSDFNKKNQPTIYKLGERLINSEDRIKNEFVSALKKVNAKQYVTLFNKTEDYKAEKEGLNTPYKVVTIEGNRNSYLNKILSIWKEEQKLNTLDRKDNFISFDNDGNYFVNKEKVNNIYNRILKANKEKAVKQEYIDLANEIIDGLGFTISEQTREDLFNNSFFFKKSRYNKDIISQFQYTRKLKKGSTTDFEPFGLFSDIVSILRGESIYENEDEEVEATLTISNPLYTDTKVARFLGELQGKYSDIITSTHTTVEGKKVYDYILPTFQFREILRAIQNPIINGENYRDTLSKDLFSSNSFFFRNVINNNNVLEEYKLGLFEAIKNEKSKKGITRDNMSFREQLVTEIENFRNEGKSTANYFDLTKSDKKTTPFHSGIPKIPFSQMGNEYAYIFKAEYIRVVNKDKLDVTAQVKKGAGIFYLLPDFNYEILSNIKSIDGSNLFSKEEIDLLWIDKDTINDKILDENDNIIEKYLDVINKVISYRSDIIINNVFDSIQKNKLPIELISKEDISSISQYAINKHIFNISLAMFTSGDPALFYKGKEGDTIVDTINRTYDEYTKRLAKDIAPGIAGSYQSLTYKAITIKVPNTFTEEYKDLFLNNYYGLKQNKKGELEGQIDPSDASQFCSVKRIANILFDYGRIPTRVYSQIMKKKDGEFLNAEELSYMYAMKPVETDRKFTPLGVNRVYSYIHYVKSSLIPLIPNITSGTELDNLRKLIEENGIDQVSLDTAGKSGNPVVFFEPFDINGNWIYKNEGDSLVKSMRVMNADAFLIQQEIPYDETKEKITFVTQLNKLILDTLTSIKEPVFEYKGEKKTGEEMCLIKEDIRKRMLDISFDELKDELGIYEDFVDKTKLRDYIFRTTSDLTTNQKLELQLDDNNEMLIPLLFNRSSNQIQSKIASAVRKAIQVKINGKSFVQITSLGIGKMDKTGEVPNDVKKVKGWDDKRLRPLRPVISELYDQFGIEIYLTQEQLDLSKTNEPFKINNEQIQQLVNSSIILEGSDNFTAKILPAQVLVPFNFFNKEQRIDINQFINEGSVDINKELLKFVGARIPNQSHSSQLPMEIVGFLPNIGGDIIYVPAEITKQMGSDFDIDKLYVYKKKYKPVKKYPDLQLKNDYILLKQKIKNQEKELQDNKLSEEEFKKVNEQIEKYYQAITSDKYLKNLKEKVISYFIESDLDSENLEKIIESFNIDDLTNLRDLTYTTGIGAESVKSKYKGETRTIYNKIKNIDSEFKKQVYNAFTVSYIEDVNKKNTFSKVVKLLKEDRELLENYKQQLNELPINYLDTNLNVNKFGEINEEYEEGIEELKNDYFDTLYNILIAPRMFDKIMQPLDMSDLQDVVSMRNKSNKNKQIKDLFNPVNQLESYVSNIGVKRLVGTFSLNLTFSTLLQRTKNMNLGNVRININNTNLNTFSGIGYSYFNGQRRTTSDNIVIPQSEAVDHAKNQTADKINLNDITANAYVVLLQLKDSSKSDNNAVSNEYSAQLINNDIVKSYVNNLKSYRDTFNDAKGKDVKQLAYEKTLEDFDLRFGSESNVSKKIYEIPSSIYDVLKENVYLTDSDLGIVRDNNGNIKELKEPENNYNLLKSFLVLDYIGTNLFQMMIATNVDTKGFGTNILEGIAKEQKINSLSVIDTSKGFPYVNNFRELFYEESIGQTELGKTVDLTLDVLNSFSEMFNYSKLNNIINQITSIKDKELNPKELRDILTNYQSYVYSANNIWENNSKERRRLMFTLGDNESLALRLQHLKLKYKNYTLFNKLETKIADKKGEPDYIVYRTLDLEADSQVIYNEFYILLESENLEIRNFVSDLVRYAYVNGGINNYNSFIQLIPPSIIINNFSEFLKNTINEPSLNDDYFVRQYYQHNPEEGQPIPKNIKFDKPIIELQVDKLSRFMYKKGKVSVKNEKTGKEYKVNKTFLYEVIESRENQDKTFYVKLLQIDTLGNYYINEYNYNNDFNNSLIPINKTQKGLHIEDLLLFESNDSISQKQEKQEQIKNLENNKIIIDSIRKESLISTLHNIEKYDTPFKDLSNILYQFIYDKNADIPIVENENGMSYYNGSEIQLAYNNSKLLRNLLHESVHHVTLNYLNQNKGSLPYVKLKLLVNSAKESLLESELSIVEEYSKAHKIKDLTERKNKYIEIEQNSTLSKKELVSLYYLSDIREFVTGVLTDVNFQRKLNNIEFLDTEVNLLDKFVEWLNKLINEIANNLSIPINNNSILRSSIQNIIELMQDIEENNLSLELSQSESIFSNEDMQEARELVKKCK